ncbi:MAG: CPBP family intramembrane metalloprotease [Candidatus Binatia bacterium]|nr:CPBP family intramembrane metalloprotease [Candidatus Binatia bacterium]
MPAGLGALLASLAFVLLLRLKGIAPYETEFSSRLRQAAAFCLWVSVLALVVFWPVFSFQEHDISLIDHGAFPLLFLNHFVLALFLLLWWGFRRDETRSFETLAAFLFLRWDRSLLRTRVLVGLFGGFVAWVATLAAVGVFAGIWLETTKTPPPEVPEVFVWIVGLSYSQKAAIILIAMTIEEAFFRAFLQPRLGLLMSSLCFALSHFSYGLPLAVFGVFVVSLLFGLLFRWAKHLLPSIMAHGVFDAVQLFLVLPWALEHSGYL